MKNRVLIAALLGSLLAYSACDSRKNGGLARSGAGEQHVFALPDSPKFLTEEMALSSARVAMDLDGLRGTNWHPMPDDRTTAPDGRKDEFLSRNTTNPNRGIVVFTNGASNLFVSVEIQGDRLFLQCSASK